MEGQILNQGNFSRNQQFMPPPYQPSKIGEEASKSQPADTQVSGGLHEMDPMPQNDCTCTGHAQFAATAPDNPRPGASAVRSDVIVGAQSSAPLESFDANLQPLLRPKRGQAFDLFAVCRGFKEMWYYGVVALLLPSVLQWRLLSPYPKMRYLVKWSVIVDAALYVALVTFACLVRYFYDDCRPTYSICHDYFCYRRVYCDPEEFFYYLAACLFVSVGFGTLLASQIGLRVYIRWSLRSKLGLTEGTKLQDCCVTTFCTSLSLIQLSEAQREEKMLEELKNARNGISRV